jgi:hypothetical protein
VHVHVGLFLALGACAAGSTVNGTVGGTGITARGSLSQVGSITPSGTNDEALIVVSDQDQMCEMLMLHETPKDSTYMQFLVYTRDVSGAPAPALGVGQYSVITGSDLSAAQVAAVSFIKFSGCASTSNAATDGSVTLTHVSADSVQGTYDLSFGDDHVTGSFVAPNCAINLARPQTTCVSN